MFWKMLDQGDAGDAPDADERGGSRRMVARGYSIFNAEQIEGYQAPATPPRADIARVPEADEFLALWGPTSGTAEAAPFVGPRPITYQMPPFEVFRNTVAYYSTLAHEVTHWTGAKTRLDQDLGKHFGNEAYAAEELAAELGEAFLCADLGLANEPRPDHAAYVANYLHLKNHKRAIFTAAAKAQGAVDFAHGLQPQPCGEPEPDPEEEPTLSATKAGQFILSF